MDMKIAVFLDNNNKTISFDEAGMVKIYSKEKEEWNVIKEIPFSIINLSSTKEIRESVINMIKDLGECKVFAATEVRGISFTILDGMGFNSYEVEGKPDDFLEHIFQSELEEKSNEFNEHNESDTKPIPMPLEGEEKGKYHIDLKIILQNNKKVTSKQILLPFLNNTNFNELEIICGHVPPWFDKEFKKLNLKSDVESIREDHFVVKVYS